MTPAAYGIVSYTTYWAATTGPMEKVSTCLWVMFLKWKAVKVVWDDHISAFNTCRNAQFLLKSKAVTAQFMYLAVLDFDCLMLGADP